MRCSNVDKGRQTTNVLSCARCVFGEWKEDDSKLNKSSDEKEEVHYASRADA